MLTDCLDRYKVQEICDKAAMILELLFMSELLVGVMDLNNVKHLKRYKRRFNACNMASYGKLGKIGASQKMRKK